MRFLGTDRDCGPILELAQIQRQLRLGAPVTDGTVETIAVAQIIGTAHRAGDFDACFKPLHATLKKRIEEIQHAAPSAMDEPIDVIRVDRAYFVSDGHKRVAIARTTGREFIDARVSHVPSPYALTAEVEEDAIERTAREGEFRRHSGIGDAVPSARFALTDVNGYGELLLAVQSYAYDRILATGKMLSASEAARLWYEEKYAPTVAAGREEVGRLLDSSTDADLFLAMHRRERCVWGSLCGDPECVADMLLADQRRAAVAERFGLQRVFGRHVDDGSANPLLLPLADGADD